MREAILRKGWGSIMPGDEEFIEGWGGLGVETEQTD